MKLEWKTCIRAGVTIAVLYLFITYWGVIAAGARLAFHAASPLILGCVVAYAVNILMSFFERHYFPRSKNKFVKKSRSVVCILISYLSLIGIIMLIIGLIVPELTSCVRLLIVKIPPLMEKISGNFSQNMELGRYISELGSVTKSGEIDWQQIITKAANWMAGSLGGAMGVVGGMISATFSTVFNIIMSIIFSIYLLAGKEKILSQLRRTASVYIKEGAYRKLQYFLSTFNESFHSFIVGQCIEAVILGSLCALGLLILRMPYAGMIGALIGFTALIPVAGAYIGGAVGFLMIATVSPVQAVVFVVFLVILQQLEGQLIYPRVVGASIGLPGIWVLAAVTVGGSAMGITGMLFFVPLASALYRLLKDDVNQRTEKRKPLQKREQDREKEECADE
ncbi:MAG: AI-2E family transporter [Roseburia sp.]|nr:AI-2E family transporter [Roseburia sp.]